jgi:hypothetical protein
VGVGELTADPVTGCSRPPLASTKGEWVAAAVDILLDRLVADASAG